MTNGNGHNTGPLRDADAHVCEVVRSAERELRQLLQQRSEIMKRIGSIKQTLAGLASLFGESVLTDELLTLLDRGAAQRRSGLTRACRQVLMESAVPISARQVSERVRQRFPDVLAHHKDPLASVNTILGRLQQRRGPQVSASRWPPGMGVAQRSQRCARTRNPGCSTPIPADAINRSRWFRPKRRLPTPQGEASPRP
jgi:chorismate mutase